MSVKDCRNPENLNGIDDGLLKKKSEAAIVFTMSSSVSSKR